MSRRRYLSTDISTDTAVNRLAMKSDFAALLYTWMIPHCGDDASIPADAEEILLLVMPGRRDKTVLDIEAALQLIEDAHFIDRVGDRFVMTDERWKKWQSNIPGKLRRLPWVKLRNKVRPRILLRDSYRCVRCGSSERLEVDHILPIRHGGGNEDENLQTLCRRCNRKKWALLPHQEESR